MAEITDPDIIYELLTNKGMYMDDPQVYRVYSYYTQEMDKGYAVFWAPNTDDMHVSPWVFAPRLLMERGELTIMGRHEINNLQLQIYGDNV